jgi:hypothetical protein
MVRTFMDPTARTTVVLLALSCALFAPATDAALISIASTDAVDNPNYDLTNVYGIGDWAYWADTSNPAASGDPSNEKSDASLIGSMSVVGGGSLRGSTSGNVPSYDFDFTDGTAPVSGTVNNLIGVFNDQLRAIGTGVQWDVISPTADAFSIYVWGTAYNAGGTLTATVGAASDLDALLDAAGSRSPGRFYTITVDPDRVGQTVHLEMLLTADNGGFANVSVAGAAVDTAYVPEPATLSLLALGGLGLLRRRRKR